MPEGGEVSLFQAGALVCESEGGVVTLPGASFRERPCRGLALVTAHGARYKHAPARGVLAACAHDWRARDTDGWTDSARDWR